MVDKQRIVDKKTAHGTSFPRSPDLLKVRAGPEPEVRSEAAQTEDKDQVLDEVEEGIDELIFRLKGIGGRPEVLEALRRARRLLYQSHD